MPSWTARWVLNGGLSRRAEPAADEGRVADTGAASLTAARQYLQGSWSLKSGRDPPPRKTAYPAKGNRNPRLRRIGNLKIDVRADKPSTDLLRDAGIDSKEGGLASNGRTASTCKTTC